MIDWKNEAQKQAADAGEIKMMLASHLDELKTSIRNVSDQLEETEERDIAMSLILKKSTLEKETEWLEMMIYGKCCNTENI